MEYIDGVRDSEKANPESAKAEAERREKMQAEARQRIEELLPHEAQHGSNKKMMMSLMTMIMMKWSTQIN